MNKTLIIIGAGGHGKACLEIAQKLNFWDKIYFSDDEKTGFINNVEIIDKEDFKKDYDYFIAIGDNVNREIKFIELVKLGYKIINLIDKNSILSSYVELGKGIVMMPGSIVNTSVRISDGVIINSGAIVEHDCKIGEFTHISPNATITGGCFIGNRVWIGASSTIINASKITDEVIIGASSLINKSITDRGTYVGVPSIKLS